MKAKFKEEDMIFLFPIELLNSYVSDYYAPIRYLKTNNKILNDEILGYIK